MADPQRAQWTDVLAQEIVARRRRAGLSQRQLAERAGVSPEWLSKIERRIVSRYPYDAVAKLEPVIGTLPGISGVASNVVGRLEDLRPVDLRRVPVYRWGSAGDPRTYDSSPDADHEEFPPVGRESLIGPRGFGVIVKGESMSRRDIHEGDIAWINPDREPRIGRPVAAHVSGPDGEDYGVVIKVLHTDGLWSDSTDNGNGPLAVERFSIIGPVVGISRFLLPS